jgi:cytochrome c oxidase subunit IV
MTDTPHNAAHWAPDQQAGGPGKEPLGEQAHPTHHADHDPGHHNDPESVRKEIRRYIAVLVALAGLTIVTVAISYLHLPHVWAIVVALIVAGIKGSLVAAVFMHLISERKLIYAVLALTVFFFGVLMWGPWHHRTNAKHSYPGYVPASSSAPATTSGAHDNAPAGAPHH